jgi:hypothetical protein
MPLPRLNMDVLAIVLDPHDLAAAPGAAVNVADNLDFGVQRSGL